MITLSYEDKNNFLGIGSFFLLTGALYMGALYMGATKQHLQIAPLRNTFFIALKSML